MRTADPTPSLQWLTQTIQQIHCGCHTRSDLVHSLMIWSEEDLSSLSKMNSIQHQHLDYKRWIKKGLKSVIFPVAINHKWKHALTRKDLNNGGKTPREDTVELSLRWKTVHPMAPGWHLEKVLIINMQKEREKWKSGLFRIVTFYRPTWEQRTHAVKIIMDIPTWSTH